MVTAEAATGATFLAGAATKLSLASSLMSTVGAITQGQQQKSAYEANAKTQRMQALDAQRRGSIAEGEARQQSKMVTGAVNANQGGSGVIAGQDTGLDILAESAEFGARDAAIIHANALRESWGLETQASNDRYQGQMAANAGVYRSGSTFLSGVSNAFAPSPWWKKQWGTSATSAVTDRRKTMYQDYLNMFDYAAVITVTRNSTNSIDLKGAAAQTM
jgi:hypothetical protein